MESFDIVPAESEAFLCQRLASVLCLPWWGVVWAIKRVTTSTLDPLFRFPTVDACQTRLIPLSPFSLVPPSLSLSLILSLLPILYSTYLYSQLFNQLTWQRSKKSITMIYTAVSHLGGEAGSHETL